MSWSVNTGGMTREDAKRTLAQHYDSSAALYAGKEEQKDVLAVKDRVLSLIDALDLADGDAISVTSYGSHTWSEKGVLSATFAVTVARSPK